MSIPIYRARSPLRIGLAGGGTDLPAYSEKFGGITLSATINMYAYASIEVLPTNKIILHSADKGEYLEYTATPSLVIDGNLDLLKGVYNRIVQDFTKEPLSLKLTTYVDAPPGSGLGSSSTLVVAIIGAFVEWLKLPLDEYDIAHLAYEIERIDVGFAGGKQDQFATVFGGFSFTEFHNDGKVIVNPLRIKKHYVNELEFNLVLFYTSISRVSSRIIEAQSDAVSGKDPNRLNAMHELKKQAIMLKEALLVGKLEDIGRILKYGWECKKKTTSEVTNQVIEQIFETALNAGATGGKITGAGGGGFILFYCPGNSRYKVIEVLQKFGGEFRRFHFVEQGLTTWTMNG